MATELARMQPGERGHAAAVESVVSLMRLVQRLAAGMQSAVSPFVDGMVQQVRHLQRVSSQMGDWSGDRDWQHEYMQRGVQVREMRSESDAADADVHMLARESTRALFTHAG